MDHLPVNRGFATHVGFLGGSEKYANGGGSADASKGHHDLWEGLTPAKDIVPGKYPSHTHTHTHTYTPPLQPVLYKDGVLDTENSSGARVRYDLSPHPLHP
jgi:hypothetical protein